MVPGESNAASASSHVPCEDTEAVSFVCDYLPKVSPAFKVLQYPNQTKKIRIEVKKIYKTLFLPALIYIKYIQQVSSQQKKRSWVKTTNAFRISKVLNRSTINRIVVGPSSGAY